MHVLVAYASRHGSTRGIAERIEERPQAAGHDADARPVGEGMTLPGTAMPGACQIGCDLASPAAAG